MNQPTFRELFTARNAPAEEVADRYAMQTIDRFDHEAGSPVVICSADEADIPILLAALGRSTVALSPLVVDNMPRTGRIRELALHMGAQVIEEPAPGQMKALQTGLRKVSTEYPEVPIFITDEDCLPPKRWAETMLRRSKLSREIGGIAHGGVILEHGPSFAADALRTGYAVSVDIQRRLRGAVPKARGFNSLLQLDPAGRILSELMLQPAGAFPSDLRVLESVLAAGGEAFSVLDPRAIVCTRGDRFKNISMLVRDLREHSVNRSKLYESPES